MRASRQQNKSHDGLRTVLYYEEEGEGAHPNQGTPENIVTYSHTLSASEGPLYRTQLAEESMKCNLTSETF